MGATARAMRRAGAGMCQVRNESAPGLKQPTPASPSAPESELRLPPCSALLPQSQQTVTVSAHAAQRCRHRVKPGLGLHAARGELERLRAMGEISAREPAWLDAANPAPYYLLSGGAIVLPLLPQADGWVATTCVTQRTLTPTRREAESTHTASRAARKRAQRRTRC